MKSIDQANLHGKKVFLRTDFNVPIVNGKIEDINRVKSTLSTITYLLGKDTKIVIGSHLGRPEGKINAETSLVPVAQELAKLLNRKVYAVNEITGQGVKDKIDQLHSGDILVLGNLRWDKREEENDKTFAKELADLADIYINDAFAVSHRKNASVDAITDFLPSYAGALLSKEMTMLDIFINNPEKPFVAIIGGVKIKDKAGIIKKLALMADIVLIGGAVGNTFLKASGKDVGESLVEDDMIETCQELLAKFGAKLVLPVDWRTGSGGDQTKILDIGPKTLEIFKSHLLTARSIFWNGNLGYTEHSQFGAGTMEIAKIISQVEGTKILAGGDTAGFVFANQLDSGFTFISTGGGAALEYLAGERLPGIEALERNA